MKRFSICGVALLAATIVVPAASAGPTFVSNLTNVPAEFKVSDDSGEFLFNRAGGTTTLDPGDVIITGFNIHTLTNQTKGGTVNLGTGGFDSVNGVSAIMVDVVSPAGGFISFKPLDAAALAAVAAKADLAGVSAILATWSHTGGPGTGLRSMVALYDAGAPGLDFERTGGGDDGDPTLVGADIGTGPFVSETAKVVTAAVGSKISEFGYVGAAGEFWKAEPASGVPFAVFGDVAIAAAQSSGSNFGAVNFGLNQTSADQMTVAKLETTALSPGNTFGLVGNANIQGTQKGGLFPVDTPFDIQDDFNGQFIILGAEPTSMALLGIGIAGLFGYGRFRRRSAPQAA